MIIVSETPDKLVLEQSTQTGALVAAVVATALAVIFILFGDRLSLEQVYVLGLGILFTVLASICLARKLRTVFDRPNRMITQMTVPFIRRLPLEADAKTFPLTASVRVITDRTTRKAHKRADDKRSHVFIEGNNDGGRAWRFKVGDAAGAGAGETVALRITEWLRK